MYERGSNTGSRMCVTGGVYFTVISTNCGSDLMNTKATKQHKNKTCQSCVPHTQHTIRNKKVQLIVQSKVTKQQ